MDLQCVPQPEEIPYRFRNNISEGFPGGKEGDAANWDPLVPTPRKMKEAFALFPLEKERSQHPVFSAIRAGGRLPPGHKTPKGGGCLRNSAPKASSREHRSSRERSLVFRRAKAVSREIKSALRRGFSSFGTSSSSSALGKFSSTKVVGCSAPRTNRAASSQQSPNPDSRKEPNHS